MNPTEEQLSELVPGSAILVGYRGSIAHNMFVPSGEPNSTDDRDIMGVCVTNLDNYFGIRQDIGHKGTFERFIGEWDSVSYELLKFARLLASSNPNAMALLWIRPELYIKITPVGKMLIDNREIFSSSLALKSFTGYAIGQLKRMTSKQEYAGYMGAKRKALVDIHGYDTKNAAHCIRLMRTGLEFVTTGELNVWREHDAEQLLDIKHGLWSLDAVKAEAERLLPKLDSKKVSNALPAQPDSNKINKLLVEMLETQFYTDN